MKTKATALLAFAFLLGLTAAPAAMPEVVVDSITMTETDEMIATFSDNGAGEIEDFVIQGSPDLQPDSWADIPAATITPISAGKWRAAIPVDVIQPTAFFRVTKNGVVLTATFSVPTVTVKEGDEAAITVTFNRPFTGTLRYTIDGTPASMPLSESSSASISIDAAGDHDDDTPGQLRSITINLELEGAGGGATSYSLGVNSSTTLIIEDNDALWSGTMKLPNKGGEVGIRILRTENDGVITTCFKTDKGGLIPTAPAGTNWLFNSFELDLDTDTFSAAVTGVTIPAGSTIYNADTELTIVFAAAGEDAVNEDRMDGEFILSTSVTGSPHLDIAARTGTFTLMRSPDQAGETSAPTTTAP